MMQKVGLRLFFLVMALMIFLNSSANEILKFEHFSNKEGFNQNTVSAIVSDKYDFLWIGTPNGLIKYDGYDFLNYTNHPEDNNCISNNYIECLCADGNGLVWIGTRSGVDVYVPQFERFLKVPLTSNLVVQSIAADTQGRIWIAGKKALYVCTLLNSAGEISFQVSDNLLHQQNNIREVYDFAFVDDSNILLCHATGISRIELDAFSTDSISSVLSLYDFEEQANLTVNSIYKANNIFWLATGSGLYKAIIDGDRLRIMQKFELKTWDKRVVTNLNVLTIFQDNEDNIWIGSSDEGIFKYNEKEDSFENYGFNAKDETGISSSRINCIYQDRFDVIWIGTAQGGLNKLDLKQKQFIVYSHNPYDENSISGNLINGVMEDSQGYLWVANYNETISKSVESVNENTIAKLRFKHFGKQLPIENQDKILSMYEDDKGFVWIGTNYAIVVYNPISNEFAKINLTDDESPRGITQYRIFYQPDANHILIGGSTLALLENPWEQIKSNKNSQIEIKATFHKFEFIRAFLIDKLGNYWFGTSDGLFKSEFKNNEFNIVQEFSTNKSAPLKLSHNDIFALHEDINGNVWVGTFGGGLNKIELDTLGEPITIEYFRKNHFLPDDAVYGILQENDKHLWISTDMGLCRFNIETNNAEIFDVRDGLSNNNFRQAAYHRGKSGYFYFGGLNGLTVFNPKTIKLNDVIPNSVITGVSINNSRIQIGEEVEGEVILKNSIQELDKITINHRTKILSFYLAAQHSTTPSKNKLAYMLEGFNNEWIETDKGKTSITYTNLPAGNFVLRVKSANGDGLWTPKTTDLLVTILPPWYKTWWSLSIFFILIALLVLGVSVYFVNHEKLKQRLKYEQIDKQRIDTINQGKLRFFTNISHEFRTPLTLIMGPLEQVLNRNKDSESAKYLTTIENNTKRLLSLVDQLITFRKAEQGHLNLNLSTDTLGHFIYPATEAFEDYAIQKNVNFFYKISSPNEQVVIDVEKTERIIFNLLSNSFRYTPAHGNISLETDVLIQDEQKMISIKVIDTGKGIPDNKRDKIFERFYQLEGRKENVGGTGIGLAFCKSLIDLMGGTISVESEPNVRTCFTILMPSESLEKESFESNDSQRQSFIKDWIPSQIEAKGDFTDSSKDDKKTNTLVIVEDEAEVRDFLKSTLGAKYSVILAENGVEGLNKIQQNEPDLVISDVMMPEMNGFELCNKIKSDSETCHIPFILLTALGDKENVIKGLEFRADDYISKPFSPRHLEIRVEQLIENTHRLKAYFSKNSSIPDTTIEISSRDKNFLKQVIRAIENNISDSNFGVEELASEIHLSQSQFYRRLKQLTGQIPNVYLRNYRLQRAAELLKSSKGLNIAEIMYEIGIESNSYFSTSFKKLHGVSPSEYVKKKHV